MIGIEVDDGVQENQGNFAEAEAPAKETADGKAKAPVKKTVNLQAEESDGNRPNIEMRRRVFESVSP